MTSVAPLYAVGATEAAGARDLEPSAIPFEEPMVRSLVTRLPADTEVWDSSYRPEPGWEFQNLESLLLERNRELQVAASEGWRLQTTVSINSPIDGSVTILDTLCRQPIRVEGGSPVSL